MNSSFLMPTISAKVQGSPSTGAPNRGGLGSNQIGNIRPISRHISETVQDRDMLTMDG